MGNKLVSDIASTMATSTRDSEDEDTDIVETKISDEISLLFDCDRQRIVRYRVKCESGIHTFLNEIRKFKRTQGISFHVKQRLFARFNPRAEEEPPEPPSEEEEQELKETAEKILSEAPIEPAIHPPQTSFSINVSGLREEEEQIEPLSNDLQVEDENDISEFIPQSFDHPFSERAVDVSKQEMLFYEFFMYNQTAAERQINRLKQRLQSEQKDSNFISSEELKKILDEDKNVDDTKEFFKNVFELCELLQRESNLNDASQNTSQMVLVKSIKNDLTRLFWL